jgi:hypothetical protein
LQDELTCGEESMAKASAVEQQGWAREIEAWRSSGQTLSAWARERGIARARLEYWKRRLAGRSEKSRGTVGRLALIPVISPPAQATPAAPIEVLVERAGLRILLPTGFEAVELRRLLDVVGARC